LLKRTLKQNFIEKNIKIHGEISTTKWSLVFHVDDEDINKRITK